VTAKHVKSVVAHRLQAASNQKSESHNQPLQTSPAYTYEIDQLVLIQCEDSATGEQCLRYSGCWGIVHDVFESAAVVAVGGEMVRYLLCDLQPIENPSLVSREVCDRVTSLWQVPNPPQSVQCLLEMFYQRRLDFSQSDLGVLAAIESCLGKA
jgi:ribosomal protein L21E